MTVAGYPEITNMTYLASSGLCIGAIACLSNQSTARLGNTLGIVGVSGGIAATLGLVNGDAALYGQILGELPSWNASEVNPRSHLLASYDCRLFSQLILDDGPPNLLCLLNGRGSLAWY